MAEFTRIKNDSNGNQRYVCHFLHLLTSEELNSPAEQWSGISEKYATALKRAHAIGGRKFHNKRYGGGVAFQCSGADEIEPLIQRAKDEAEIAARHAARQPVREAVRLNRHESEA